MGRKIQEKLLVISTIVLLYAVMQLLGITCPIKYITGVSCAGCGMSRAWISLLCFDIHRAFSYHPLFWLPPIAVVLYLLRNKFSKRTNKVFIIVFCMIFVAVYLYRLIYCSSSVVVFAPKEGILYKLYIMLQRSICGLL